MQFLVLKCVSTYTRGRLIHEYIRGNPLTAAIGRPFFGQKSPAARELFKPSTNSASLLVEIKKKRFSF